MLEKFSFIYDLLLALDENNKMEKLKSTLIVGTALLLSVCSWVFAEDLGKLLVVVRVLIIFPFAFRQNIVPCDPNSDTACSSFAPDSPRTCHKIIGESLGCCVPTNCVNQKCPKLGNEKTNGAILGRCKKETNKCEYSKAMIIA